MGHSLWGCKELDMTEHACTFHSRQKFLNKWFHGNSRHFQLKNISLTSCLVAPLWSFHDLPYLYEAISCFNVHLFSFFPASLNSCFSSFQCLPLQSSGISLGIASFRKSSLSPQLPRKPIFTFALISLFCNSLLTLSQAHQTQLHEGRDLDWHTVRAKYFYVNLVRFHLQTKGVPVKH